MRLSVARARLLEWRRRDPNGALAVVEDARRRMPETAPELEGRHIRLLRKVAKRSEKVPTRPGRADPALIRLAKRGPLQIPVRFGERNRAFPR